MATDYSLTVKQLDELAEEEPFYVPLMSNASALLWEALGDVNWVGFYFMRNGGLVLGPFQGKAACIHIQVGKGVCGTCVREDRVQRVPDVHLFPGHIACDSDTNSEIVLPIHKDGRVVAVLDIDSKLYDRFSEEDAAGLRLAAESLERNMIWE